MEFDPTFSPPGYFALPHKTCRRELPGGEPGCDLAAGDGCLPTRWCLANKRPDGRTAMHQRVSRAPPELAMALDVKRQRELDQNPKAPEEPDGPTEP